MQNLESYNEGYKAGQQQMLGVIIDKFHQEVNGKKETRDFILGIRNLNSFLGELINSFKK